MKFDVHFGAGKKASFRNGPDAQEYAQFMSEKANTITEVIYTGKRGGGIVGQYKHGMPTPEFRGRGDEWYPAGPRETVSQTGAK